MKKAMLVRGLLGAIILLPGCSSLQRQTGIYNGYGVKPLSGDAITKLQEKTQEAAKKADDTCFASPVEEKSVLQCTQSRNATISLLTAASDGDCQEHLKSIYGNEAAANLTAGTTTSLFAGAATITTPISAARILSAIAAFSSAERSLINEVVYKEKISNEIVKKIRAVRSAKASEIAKKRAGQDVNSYSFNDAIADITDYHYSCSFMVGLEKLLEEGQQDSASVLQSKLEKEKATIEAYRDTRRITLGPNNFADDPGFKGATLRIQAIEAQLLSLISTTATGAASSASSSSSTASSASSTGSSSSASSRGATNVSSSSSATSSSRSSTSSVAQ